MPIQSITGKPGNAKTAFMVKRILEEAHKAERPLWAAGIDGLQPGLCNVFKDPREWNAVRPGEVCTCNDTEDETECTAHVIPNGSLIFIDEAWKWFGHLQDASRQSTPAHVLQLAEHRHRGLDFVWTYQQPSQIFPFARGLMAEHRHLVRKYGTQFCDAYDWQELNEDVKSQAKRDGATRSTVAIPKETFGLYKSAEVHTIKRKLPGRLFLLPLALLGAIGAIWLAFNMLKPKDANAAPGTAEASADSSAPPTSTVAQRKGEPAYSTVEEYIAMTTARIPAIPWTAPAFDGRDVKAEPEIYCMSGGSGAGVDGEHLAASCSCITEQGTDYVMDAETCRSLARHGQPYNPFKEKREEREREPEEWRGVGQGPTVTARSGAPVRGTAQPFGSVAEYGALGVGDSAP